MGEYTDREIEMLARFAHEQSGDDVPWSNLRNERKADMRAYAREKVDERGMFSHIIRAAARLMREARAQGQKESALYRANDVVLARSPLAASCVRQGVTAQAAANAFEFVLNDLSQEFIRHRTNSAAAMTIKLDAMSTDLIAKASERGAAEMRERAALVALQSDICPVDGPVAAERIRALPLTVAQ